MAFKDILKSAFPFISIAASMGGPLGTMAAQQVGHVLGIDKVDPTTEGITTAITTAQTTDKDALFKIQAAEDAFKLQMAQLGFDSAEKMASIDAGDRQSARAREIAVKDRTPMILAYFVVFGTMILESIVMFHGTPPSVDGVVLGRVLGTLDTATALVLAYYFGSSASSRVKDQTISDQANANATK